MGAEEGGAGEGGTEEGGAEEGGTEQGAGEMAKRAATSVTVGLRQLAQLDRQERARIVRQLCSQHPDFRAMFRQVAVARAAAFGSGLTLAAAVVALAQRASVWWVAGLVFAGLAGFCYVAVALTDSRFDLLMAVLGAHRTDELYGRLVTEQIYGGDAETTDELPRVLPPQLLRGRAAEPPWSPVHADG